MKSLDNQALDQKGPRVAVIGAGLAGLTAAYELRRQGATVTIIEKGQSAGGRAQTISKDGFELNLGPHALYKGGAAYRFMDSIGLAPTGAAPLLKKATALYNSKRHELPLTPGSVLRTTYLNWTEKIELALVMSKLAKLDLTSIMSVSLADWLAANVKGNGARQTIAAFVRLATYCDNTQQMSAGAAFQQLLLANQGVLYLDHGWHSMINALMEALSNDVKFEFNGRVQSVKPAAEGIEVIVNDHCQRFDAAVLCLPPDQVNKLVPGALDSATMAGIIPSMASCLDICLKKLPNPGNTFVLGIDEPLYFSLHSKAAKLAPIDGAVLHLAYYLGSAIDHGQSHEQRLYDLLDQFQPGWRDELIYKRFLPHVAASFGTPAACHGGASGLQSPLLAKLPNIYICGDYVGGGAQLADCAIQSALQAAAMLSQSPPKTRISDISDRKNGALV